jgi:hypothetical protein
MTDMSDDELRARLSRLDPVPAGSPVDPVTSPRAQELVERAMQTPETQTVPTPDPTDELAARRRRPWLIPLVAAALLAAVVGTVVVLSGGGRVGDTSGGDAATAQEPTTLDLSLPPSNVANSCVVFDVEFLAEVPVALAGTVTAVEPRRVTLEVDRWYRGGDADVVTIGVQDGNSVALDGVDFREGERYLVTATNGVINGCGFSGPATPELEQAFEQAFG